MTTLPRTACPTCTRGVALRADGTLTVHHPDPPDGDDPTRHCPQSRRLPDDGPYAGWSCCGLPDLTWHTQFPDGRCLYRWRRHHVNVPAGTYTQPEGEPR